MEISHATCGAPGHPNEDLVVAGDGWAAVLDGATPAPGTVSGCEHGVRWLVRELGAGLAARLARASAEPLPDLLASVIAETMAAHGGRCDLTRPDSPSATVCIARARDGWLDYLVLCDSPIVLRHQDGRASVIADDRLEHLPGGRPYSAALIRACRNQPGGFWVASTDPQAARQAVHGSAERDGLTGALLCTDGVSRLADHYGHPWPAILDRLDAAGPAGLITWVRAAERADPPPSGKHHDDATAVYLRW